MAETPKHSGDRPVTENRKARHDYEILETFEAGMVLTGSEVKSLRAGRANLKDSYARVDRGEVFLLNAHISPYAAASHFGHEPERNRKLLLHRAEIDKLLGRIQERGLTVVPLKIYFKNGRAKALLGVGRGKKAYDKREPIKKGEAERLRDGLWCADGLDDVREATREHRFVAGADRLGACDAGELGDVPALCVESNHVLCAKALGGLRLVLVFGEHGDFRGGEERA